MALLKEAAVKVGLARLAEGRNKPVISVGRQPPPDLCCVGLVQQVVRREKEQLLGWRLWKAADLRKAEPRHTVAKLELIHLQRIRVVQPSPARYTSTRMPVVGRLTVHIIRTLPLKTFCRSIHVSGYGTS